MNLLKTMSLSLFLALFLIGTNTTFAQSRATNLTAVQKDEIKKNLQEYAAALDLSEDQRPQFKEITMKYAKHMIAVKESGDRPMGKVKKVKSIRESKNAEMKRLLSTDQYKVYLEKQEEMKKSMKERRQKSR